MTKNRQVGVLAAIAALLVMGTGTANATHSWGGYHWSRTSNPFSRTYGDNLSSNWKSYLSTSVAQWSVTSGSCNNSGNPVRASVVAGAASGRKCSAAAGRVEVCNGSYGQNGWLGIAGISVSGTHITSGYVKLNDTYFSMAQYNTPTWRQFVMSQETGHILGLDHQDTDFNNADLLDACGRGSCMDYSSDVTNQTTPNQHDYDELVTIYSHLDAAAAVLPANGFPADDGVDVEDPSTWGQAKSFVNGRGVVYERDLGERGKRITFVLWAN